MPRKTTKAAAAVVSRDEARDLYLAIYDDFALDVEESHRPIVAAINERFSATGSEQTIVESEVNGGKDGIYWQTFQTYDSVPREVAEALFDDAWPTADVEVEAPAARPASTTVASAVCHCGCGEPASKGKGYKPGHDARHAGAVARAILGGVTAATPAELLATLPTPALRAKAQAQVDRGNAKQAVAKVIKRAVKRPGAPEEGVVLDGFVTYNGDLQPAQRGMIDGKVYLNINDNKDGSGDWLDSEGFDRKTQAYWLKRFVIDQAPAPAKAAPAKRSTRKRGSAVGGDGPEALKSLLTF